MADNSVMPTDVQTIMQLSVPLIVRIGQRNISVDDVLSLGPGAILELGRSADDELDLLINNKPIGRGVAVKVAENFGVRITSVAPQRDRVEAMGQ